MRRELPVRGILRNVLATAGDGARFASPSSRRVRLDHDRQKLAWASNPHRVLHAVLAGVVATAIWVGDRHARSLAEDVRRRQLRLVELRRSAEARVQASEHPDPPIQPAEAQTFFAVTDEGVEEVEIYLDERLIDRLNRSETAVWKGLIEYIEDDLSLRGSA